MHAAELHAPQPVFPRVSVPIPSRRTRTAAASASRARPALLGALALSLLLHAAGSMWPVEWRVVDETPALTATLTVTPAPPVPRVEPPAAPRVEPHGAARNTAIRPPAPNARLNPRRTTRPAVIAALDGDATIDASAVTDAETTAPAPNERSPAVANSATSVASASPAARATLEAPPVVLPPRLDLAYKVFFGTRGFVVGDATYRFEHAGDRYTISTVAEARGLAALVVHGKGRIESRGRITPEGLKPYEFAIERGNPDKREEAFFDWDAGNVVLHDGAIAQLDAPAFDPLTILWQPYFSPPSHDDQTFSLATTRRVAKYTLSLEGEETVAWPHGEVATERWHRRSDDGKSEAWFWLAPSMHYIPVKMRVSRPAGGTLEVLLDAIRTDGAATASSDAAASQADETAVDKPWNPMEPMPGPDAHGQ